MDNILLGRNVESSGLSKIIQSLKLDALIERVREKNESVADLSGGERQKIAIARSLIDDKDILLVDEPTSALDKTATQVAESMILSQKDKLTIVVTHNINENLKDFDEIIVLNKGRMQESGSYAELREKGIL